jgi:hypothetical protein
LRKTDVTLEGLDPSPFRLGGALHDFRALLGIAGLTSAELRVERCGDLEGVDPSPLPKFHAIRI